MARMLDIFVVLAHVYGRRLLLAWPKKINVDASLAVEGWIAIGLVASIKTINNV